MIDKKLKQKLKDGLALIRKLKGDVGLLTQYGYKFVGESTGSGAYTKNGIVIKHCYLVGKREKVEDHLIPTLFLNKKRENSYNRFAVVVQPFCKKIHLKKHQNQADKIRVILNNYADVCPWNMGVFKDKVFIIDF